MEIILLKTIQQKISEVFFFGEEGGGAFEWFPVEAELLL